MPGHYEHAHEGTQLQLFRHPVREPEFDVRELVHDVGSHPVGELGRGHQQTKFRHDVTEGVSKVGDCLYSHKKCVK